MLPKTTIQRISSLPTTRAASTRASLQSRHGARVLAAPTYAARRQQHFFTSLAVVTAAAGLAILPQRWSHNQVSPCRSSSRRANRASIRKGSQARCKQRGGPRPDQLSTPAGQEILGKSWCLCLWLQFWQGRGTRLGCCLHQDASPY
jgi:hypothetical protein